jgi:DNA-binding NarL/FixJ family response regulator
MNLADEFVVLGAVPDGASALAQIDLATPDVVLLDPRLPDLADGLNLMRRLSAQWPTIRIVAMSCWDELENPALRTGAAAFVSKGGQPAEFVQAVVAAARRSPGRR